ncbi:hypothetical protein B5X24_HaOG215987 [Helicoverpa armigera]|nr:hypothetical protein B5X24_HaOG215987 [Helicoverpa armigera]
MSGVIRTPPDKYAPALSPHKSPIVEASSIPGHPKQPAICLGEALVDEEALWRAGHVEVGGGRPAPHARARQQRVAQLAISKTSC